MKDAFKNVVAAESESEDELFVPRRKTQQEAAEEEKEYAEFAKDRLAGECL